MLAWKRLAALVLVLSVPATARAQAGAPADSGEDILLNVVKARALEVRLRGAVNMTGNQRNARLLDINRAGLLGPAGVAGRSEGFVLPEIRLGLDADFANKVHGTLDIGNRKYNSYPAAVSMLGATATGGNVFGSPVRTLDALHAYLTFDQFLFGPSFKLVAGVQPFAVKLREQGGAFFIDVDESEDAFFGFNNDVGANGGAANGYVSSGASAFTHPAGRDGVSNGTGPGTQAGYANTQEAGGVRAIYQMGSTAWDFFYFTLAEGRDTRTERTLWGTTASLKLGHGKLQGILATLTNRSSARVYTWGGGVDYVPFDTDRSKIEVYAEMLFQHGYFARQVTDLPIAGLDIRQDAWAGYAGLRYDTKVHTLKPYLDLSFTEVSGDDDAGDRVNEDFLSLENNDATLIAEADELGLDIDANYRKVQLQLGVKWDLFHDDRMDDDLTLELLYAYLELSKNTRGQHDKIGDELDFRATWRYSENLKLYGATGFLMDGNRLGTRKTLNAVSLGLGFEF